jgi:hypothetical protein
VSHLHLLQHTSLIPETQQLFALPHTRLDIWLGMSKH